MLAKLQKYNHKATLLTNKSTNGIKSKGHTNINGVPFTKKKMIVKSNYCCSMIFIPSSTACMLSGMRLW